MKNIIILLSILMMCNLGFCKSFLIIDKETKDVVSLSPIDDAQINDNNWEKIIIPQDFKDIRLQYHPIYYKYENGKFIVNIKKLSDEALAKKEIEKKAAEERMITERMRKIAREQLVKEGKLK